ncbi:MAG: YraN family protein [Deltaproteobacteria bacterium]|nr:MAG: YraN family protein [Deltaproteobacteria bacterium]
MTARSRQFGKKNEELAISFLKRLGYRVIEQNFRTRMGEVDIIARDGDTLVFVEVKARRSARYGHPKFAVTPAKQRHLSIAALSYLKKTGNGGTRARFDVITVKYAGGMPTVEHFKNAFDLAYG